MVYLCKVPYLAQITIYIIYKISCICGDGMLCRICIPRILIPHRTHLLDHAHRTAPTRWHELHHSDILKYLDHHVEIGDLSYVCKEFPFGMWLACNPGSVASDQDVPMSETRYDTIKKRILKPIENVRTHRASNRPGKQPTGQATLTSPHKFIV